MQREYRDTWIKLDRKDKDEFSYFMSTANSVDLSYAIIYFLFTIEQAFITTTFV